MDYTHGPDSSLLEKAWNSKGDFLNMVSSAKDSALIDDFCADDTK